MSLMALEVAMQELAPLPDDDADAYRRMARRYHELVPMPGRKRSLVAAIVAAEEFGFDLSELRARSRKRPVAIARQKVTAFASIISKGSTRDIAGVMDREHSTVLHALEKYEDEIRSALGGNNESRK